MTNNINKEELINFSTNQENVHTANVSNDNSQTIEYARKSFFSSETVKERKQEGLKNRLRALILERGMSEPEFFHEIGISRQYWWRVSWGIEECPIYLKVKIARALNVDSRVIWEKFNE